MGKVSNNDCCIVVVVPSSSCELLTHPQSLGSRSPNEAFAFGEGEGEVALKAHQTKPTRRTRKYQSRLTKRSFASYEEVSLKAHQTKLRVLRGSITQGSPNEASRHTRKYHSRLTKRSLRVLRGSIT